MLISKTGKAQVCDYGLSSITLNPTFTVAKIPGIPGPSRWLAPEIIDSTHKANASYPKASKPADVFAFAMLSVEVFTGRVPFGNMKNESVIIQIVNGKRPAKPQVAEQLGITAEMWKFIEKCWGANPNKRPTIDEVVRTWEGFVKGYVVPCLCSSANRRIMARNGSPSSASRTSRRRTKFAGSSTACVEKCSESFLIFEPTG